MECEMSFIVLNSGRLSSSLGMFPPGEKGDDGKTEKVTCHLPGQAGPRSGPSECVILLHRQS